MQGTRYPLPGGCPSGRIGGNRRNTMNDTHRMKHASMAGLLMALLTVSSSIAQPQPEAFASPETLPPDSAIDTPAMDDLPSVQIPIPREQDDALVGFTPNGTAFVA